MVIERHSPSPEYTSALAAGFADLLASGDVVLLSGQLGSGKTTFTRDVAGGLGIERGLVSSPTFVMLNIYPAGPRVLPGVGGLGLAHLDAYRLHTPEDLEPLGWDRVFDVGAGAAAAGRVLMVEWPERIAGALPPEDRCARVTIEQTGAAARRFTFSLPESWRGRAAMELFATNAPIKCPTTKQMVSPTSPTYPFADQRARDADLYKWFSGEYQITRPIEKRDLDQE